MEFNENARQVMYDLLEGGAIKRYHMKQTIKEQAVSTHSWRMAAIIHSLWPDCSKALIMAALFHDVSERVTGDIPSPVKRANPALRSELNRVTTEEEIRLDIRYELTLEEQNLLSWVDRFEGCLFCLDEIQFGNKKMHNTFLRYLEMSSDSKLREGVAPDRQSHIIWLHSHLLHRATELGIHLP